MVYVLYCPAGIYPNHQTEHKQFHPDRSLIIWETLKVFESVTRTQVQIGGAQNVINTKGFLIGEQVVLFFGYDAQQAISLHNAN